MAPLWLTMPTGPSAGGASMNIVEKLATAPVPKLASPCEFGPTMRRPRARARAAISASRALPPAVSPKPEAIITATLTPSAAHSSRAATAASPGTAMIARSGAASRSESRGTAFRPCTSLRLGLIGCTAPRKPKRER